MSKKLLENTSLVLVVFAKLDEISVIAGDQRFAMSSIWEEFRSMQCPLLAGYPKMFYFLQADEVYTVS